MIEGDWSSDVCSSDLPKNQFRFSTGKYLSSHSAKALIRLHVFQSPSSNSANILYLRGSNKNRPCIGHKILCLTSLLPCDPAKKDREGRIFAKVLLASCTGSKTYCSTLFGIVPIKDASVARKIAEEIDFVTRTYPQKLELADEFAPFREVMVKDRKSTRLNSSHPLSSRMPSSA